MSYYGQGLDKVGAGLKAIADALERAAEKQGSPITYTIVVNTGPTADADQIATKVVETIKRAEARRGQAQ